MYPQSWPVVLLWGGSLILCLSTHPLFRSHHRPALSIEIKCGLKIYMNRCMPHTDVTVTPLLILPLFSMFHSESNNFPILQISFHFYKWKLRRNYSTISLSSASSIPYLMSTSSDSSSPSPVLNGTPLHHQLPPHAASTGLEPIVGDSFSISDRSEERKRKVGEAGIDGNVDGNSVRKKMKFKPKISRAKPIIPAGHTAPTTTDTAADIAFDVDSSRHNTTSIGKDSTSSPMSAVHDNMSSPRLYQSPSPLTRSFNSSLSPEGKEERRS